MNHSVNESKYIEDCVSAKRIQVFEEGVLEGELSPACTRNSNLNLLTVWQMSCASPAPSRVTTQADPSIADHLPFPTTNRDFVILIYTIDTSQPTIPGTPPSPRSFQVVSVPCEHPEAPVRKGWIRGKYVSVEEVVEEGDEVVWRCVFFLVGVESEADENAGWRRLRMRRERFRGRLRSLRCALFSQLVECVLIRCTGPARYRRTFRVSSLGSRSRLRKPSEEEGADREHGFHVV